MRLGVGANSRSPASFYFIIILITSCNADEKLSKENLTCKHCCDDAYPKEGTPVYYMTQGPRVNSGDTGDKGDTGPCGPKGEKGDTGETGERGAEGPPGVPGMRGLPAPPSPKSAFSVARSKPLLGNDTMPLPVTFDKEFVNLNNEFDTATSRFICHYPGVYFFTYTVQSYMDKFLGIQLMKNNEPQVILYANAVPRRIMQSQNVMLQLQAGNIVWLRQAKGMRFALYGNSDLQITFSGYLVYPT